MDASRGNQSAIMRVLTVIFSILVIVAGGYLLFRPRLVVWVFSVGAVVYGIEMLVGYFTAKDGRSGWICLGGIVNIIFGAIMLFGGVDDRVFGVVAIEYCIAFWAMFIGISIFLGSFDKKKAGVKGWGWSLAGGILTVICGIVYMSMPLFGAVMLVGFAGIYAGIAFVVMGISSLAAALSTGEKAAE